MRWFTHWYITIAVLLTSILLHGIILAMVKTPDDLDLWRFQDKRAPISFRILGDFIYAEKYLGEGKALLWSLKNDMSFRRLTSGKRIQPYPDGTVITVRSLAGLDIVEIDTRRSTRVIGAGAVVTPTCKIRFLNLPDTVAPMRYPGQIHAGEAEGKDYLKLYYQVDTSQCPTCAQEEWNLCDQNSPDCDQFKFVMAGIPEAEGKPNDHCVYSSSTCHIQLLGHGVDARGRYLIIKIFTEWSYADPSAMTYSRTGMGTGLLDGKILDKNGKMICEAKATIAVDCCKKDSDARKVILWDESTTFGGPREIMFVEGQILYKTPAIVNIYDLIYYALWGSGTFWAGYNGGCPPFGITFTGPGSIKKDPMMGSVQYIPPGNTVGCNDRVKITIIDRCETSATVETKSCCETENESGGAVTINYITLVMGCNGQQNFSAQGGCPPYKWSCDFGSFSKSETGLDETTYTSPATNANCASNPTITVTDCCGATASIKLAVNCAGSSYAALQMCAWAYSTCKCDQCSPSNACMHIIFVGTQYRRDFWDCNGNSWGTPCIVNADVGSYGAGDCIPAPGCNEASMPQTCTNDACKEAIDSTSSCNLLPTCGDCYGIPCNTLADIRTPADKAAGCCPLNPYTGLPY